YMSPEQFSGERNVVDERTDVYALGVCLYQLVSGAVPFDIGGRSVEECARVVREVPPRSMPPEAAVERDLRTIVSKSLEKDRNRRYPSATALADDLRRFLRHQPIDARPASSIYQLKMFARRNRALVGAVGAIVVVSFIATVISLRFAFRANANARAAQRDAHRLGLSSAARSVEAGAFYEAERDLARTPPTERDWLWRCLNAQTDRVDSVPQGDAFVATFARSGDGQVLLTASLDKLRVINVGRRRVVHEIDMAEPFGLSERRGRHVDLSLDETGTRFSATLRERDRAWTWIGTTADGTIVLELERATGLGNAGMHAALSPDGALLAWVLSTDGSPTAGIAIYDVASGVLRGVAPYGTRTDVAWRPDSKAVFLIDEREGAKDVIELSATSLSVLRRVHVGVLADHLVLSPGGEWLLGSGERNSLFLLDLTSADAQPRFLELPKDLGLAQDADIDPSGTWLLTSHRGGAVAKWDLVSGEILGRVRLGSGPLSLRLLDEGRAFAAGFREDPLQLLDTRVFRDPHRLVGHRSYVYAAIFDRAGRRILSGGWDGFGREAEAEGSLRWWDALSGAEIGRWRSGELYVVALERIGERRVAALAIHSRSADRILLAIDTRTGRVVARRDLGSVAPSVPKFDRATQRLCIPFRGSGAEGSYTLLLDPATLETEERWDSGALLEQNPEGRWLAHVRGDLKRGVPEQVSKFALINPVTGSATWSREFVDVRSERLSFDASGDRFLMRIDRAVHVFDASSGEPLFALPSRGAKTLAMTHTSNGSHLLTGNEKGDLVVFDARTLDLVTSIRGHDDYVYEIVAAEGSERFVSTSGDGTLRIWDAVPTRERLASWRERERLVLRLSPRVERLLDEEGLSPGEAMDRI
ncbi:MAG: hypothetical protein AAGG01_17400, partial [Planctomycetota bacterium]